MKRGDLDDLAAFVAIAEERSFTRAASRLGISQSALSHAFKALEERLGLPLLARTSRSVAPTAAGEHLLRSLRPALGDIDAALEGLRALRDQPSGTVRLTTTTLGAQMVLQPVLAGFLRDYPDVTVELTVEDGFTDIVKSGYDAGLRFGEHVDRDMIAVRVSPDIEAAVVATPEYFAEHPRPRAPRDLAKHRCLNYRLKSAGGLYAWRFHERGRPFEVRVQGPFIANDGVALVGAALDSVGVAYLWEFMVREHVASGRLVRVLGKWCAPVPGFYLYYPQRRQSPALAALVARLRQQLR